MTSLFDPLPFARGPAMKNRFMLAAMTNCQSHPDGTLSADEFHWLTMRAKGGFGLTMTCAAHVQAQGQGFPGQLGVFSDAHLPGLSRLAAEIKRYNSRAVVQLHHAGIRSPADLVGKPVGPSDHADTKSRGLTRDETLRVRDDFIAAAARCEKAGFDGVELHGAHGYILCQYLSEETNQRTDEYGGSLENRERLLMEIIDGVRAACGRDFTLGVRLSPERFGIKLGEARATSQRLMREGRIDFLDVSLWDFAKKPNEEEFHARPILEWFTDLERGNTRLGAAGKIYTGAQAQYCLDKGLDAVIIGRAAILHHDLPERIRANPHFTPAALPVSPAYLHGEGLSDTFVKYMRRWEGFVAPLDEAA